MYLFSFRKCHLLPMVVLAMVGCDKVDEVVNTVQEQAEVAIQQGNEAVTEVKETVTQTVDEVKEQTGLAGKMELAVDGPVNVNACYVKFITSKSSRPNVLQVQSYRDADTEGFPSIFMHAKVTDTALAELAGKTVPLQLFIQKQENGPVWSSGAETPVQLKIDSVDENNVIGSIVGGEATETGKAAASQVTGTITGVIEG